MMTKRRNNPLCKVGDAVSVNVDTGEETTIEGGGAYMLSSATGTCAWCAVKHDPEQPHNKDSLYYQMKFHAIKGRWPTWTDAMEHCADDVKSVWRNGLIEQMKEHDLPVPQDLLTGAS